MPNVCCVPGCRSNYKGETYTNITTFPKDPERKKQWEKLCHRKDFKVSDSTVICFKHFEERFIERDHKAVRDDGTLLIVPRKYPILTPDALPTIFPNLPSYLSKVLPPKRKAPEERSIALEKRQENKFRQWVEEDKIKDFEDFKKNFEKKLSAEWIVINKIDNIYIGKPDITDSPIFIVSIMITKELTVTVWHNNAQVAPSKLKWILGKECKCGLWTAFECLLSHLQGYEKNVENKDYLCYAIDFLKKFIDGSLDNETLNENILFLYQQLKLCSSTVKRYEPEMLLWAENFYFTHPAAYRLVRNSGRLNLPHPHYLKTLLQNRGNIESGLKGSHLKYEESVE